MECSLCTLRISVADMIALGVRNRRADSPEFLYQRLPLRALTLMATLPRGSFAVSISQGSDWLGGFPITREAPLCENGFVLAYARKLNNRYEAIAVNYRHQEFSLEQFFQIATQWVADHLGGLKPIYDRFSYCALNKEEWSFILRDNGYVAWDPMQLSSKLPKAFLNKVLVRIPVYGGNAASQEEGFPVFSPIEVAIDPNTGLQGEWISFKTYQDLRAVRSILPAAIVPDLAEWLALLTKESCFDSWMFRSGMLFGDPVEWWGECNRRRTVHEGIDFAEGWHPVEGKRAISEGTPVRSIAEGEVVAIVDDFIGKTVITRHPAIRHANGDLFHSFLSHMQPEIEGLGPTVKGQVLGRVGRPISILVSPHLHLTGAWIPDELRIQEIGLDVIHPGFAQVALVNLNEVVSNQLPVVNRLATS
jgi:murein DD-endopeptidase MepM/ murein hydrolase activator NlpD